MKCYNCINYGTCKNTCNISPISEICSGFKNKNEGYCPSCDNYDRCVSDYKENSGCCDYYIKKKKSIDNKTCSNCIYDDEEDGCRVACIRQEHFKPKEKPVENKVIFESDEALDKFLDDCEISDKELRKCIKYFAKFKGYARKSIVEEAEEMYMKWNYNHNNNIENGWSDTVAMIYSLYNGFQYLKARQK